MPANVGGELNSRRATRVMSAGVTASARSSAIQGGQRVIARDVDEDVHREAQGSKARHRGVHTYMLAELICRQPAPKSKNLPVHGRAGAGEK